MFPRYLTIAAGFLLSLNAGVALADDAPSHGSAQFDRLFGVTTTQAVHGGRPALRIELSEEEQAAQLAGAGGNRPTFAVLDVPFANGVIEVDIAAEINGRGGKDARGFAGIAFHLTEDGEAFEAVYLRMSNGTANVPPPPSPATCARSSTLLTPVSISQIREPCGPHTMKRPPMLRSVVGIAFVWKLMVQT